jgi:pimeloyl-ACP methyl ester carboxylesterase
MELGFGDRRNDLLASGAAVLTIERETERTPMPTVVVDGEVHLHYREAGTGPTLLFHPGFSNNLDVWNWLVRELAPTHRCVTFDPRGHGASDKPDSAYTLDELGHDVAVLAQRLDLPRVTLVGHSLGGAVSLTTVLDHNADGRITRLALLAPATPCFLRPDNLDIGTPPEAFNRMLTGVTNSWVPSQFDVAAVFYHQSDPATARWLAVQTLAMPVHIAERYFSQLATIDFRRRLTEVRVPVLVLWGEHDQLADPRWAHWLREQDLPRWSVEMLEHSGHGAMVDEPARIAELLRQFTLKPQGA